MSPADYLFMHRDIFVRHSFDGWVTARRWMVDEGDMRMAKLHVSLESATKHAATIAKREGRNYYVCDREGRIIR